MPRFLTALALAAFLGSSPEAPAPTKTWGQRLGYPAGKRVLLLHADDIGMCYEANAAAQGMLERHEIQSAAAMAPCPWFDAFVTWAKKHPQKDIGLHLTLTSEWKRYRWPPVLPKAQVPGLVDKDGYLHRNVPGVALSAKSSEVEAEIRAQIQRALDRGLNPGHLDTHMGTLYAREDFTAAYLKVAVEFDIPAMVIAMTPQRIAQFRKQGYPSSPKILEHIKRYPGPKLDNFLTLSKGKSYEEVRAKFFATVRSLKPGITEIIFHPSIESEAMRAITNSWRQRGWEAKLFGDPLVKKFLADEGVLFTNWREMKRRFKGQKKTPKLY